MNRVAFFVTGLLFVVGPAGAEQQPAKSNVLFLCVDDMKDWVDCLGGYCFDHNTFTWTNKKTGKTTHGKEQ